MSPDRGGKREGAGRRPRIEREGKEPKVALSCRVEAETKAFLEQEKEDTCYSIGEIVDHAVALYVSIPGARLAPKAEQTEEN